MSTKAVERLQMARKLRHSVPVVFQHSYVDDLLDAVEGLLPYGLAEELFAPCKVVTAMSGEAYRAFMSEGTYKTFWEVGATWHHKYSQDPEHGRLFNEMRLFGEKVVEGAYAVVLPGVQYSVPYESVNGLLAYLYSHGKADKVIEWKLDVLRDSTFTYGDSQQHIMAHEFSPKRMAAWAFSYSEILRMRMGIPVDARFKRLVDREHLVTLFTEFLGLPGVRYNPYFEIQIHRRLTVDDVKGLLSV